MGLGREMFWIGGGGCLNSCQLSVVSCQRSAVSGQKLSEAGFTGFIGFAGLGVGVTNPSHNRTTTNNSRKRRESEFPPTEESGLQTPPTRDITIKNRGYKPLPQKI